MPEEGLVNDSLDGSCGYLKPSLQGISATIESVLVVYSLKLEC